MKKRIVAITILTVLALTLFMPLSVLMVFDEEGLIRWFHFAPSGQRFTVRFTHSVALRPVDETYSVDHNVIVIEETRYDMNGAGLPYEARPDQTMTIEEGQYVLRGFNVKLPELTYRISRTVADHLFIFENITHRLREWGRPGGAVTFRTGRRSLLACLIGRLLPLSS